MNELGVRLSTRIPRGAIVRLEGDLGAGKTTLVRGILRGFGYEGDVTSPTYTLLESYQTGQGTVHHFDLYRLEDPMELENIGIRDLLDDTAIALVEWPDRGHGVLPASDRVIHIEFNGSGRVVSLPRQWLPGAAERRH